ncbi:MAG: hypothetical protein D6824_02845 [Planctomycetota bacterium]|nr:MAG: hypothetical protein D6824_02845 [Planctomycetota bacterium]
MIGRWIVIAGAFLLQADAQGQQTLEPRSPAAFLEAVNERFASTPDEARVERTLFPALAKMAPAPTPLDEPTLALLWSGQAEWATIEAWALEPPQREALAALESAATMQDGARLALPYDCSRVDSGWAQAGLCVEVGDPPLLAAAQFRYFDRLRALAALVSVEIERRLEQGQAAAAADLALQLFRMGRLVADRAFAREMEFGLLLMRFSLGRALDALHRAGEGVTAQQLSTLQEALQDDAVQLDRLLPPVGERLAAEQLVQEAFVERDGPDPAAFPVLAAMASAEDPALAISRAEWWKRAMERHAGVFETVDALRGVFDDWALRWKLDPQDPVLRRPSEFRRLDPAKFAILTGTLFDQERLMELRLRLRTRIAGARTALGILGYRADRGIWPKPLTAIRPRYVRRLPVDPLAPAQLRQPVQFFVPVRDQRRGPRELPKPHRIVVTGSLAQELEAQPSMLEAWRRSLEIKQVEEDDQAFRARRSQATLLLQALAALGVTVDNAQTVLATDLGKAREQLAEALGADAAQVDFALEVVRTLFTESEPFRKAYSSVVQRSGRGRIRLNRVDDRTLRTILVEAERAAMTVQRRSAAQGAPRFGVDLDESDFVLYSVGFDLQADWARSAGPLGSDELLWPPLLSLYRQRHLRPGTTVEIEEKPAGAQAHPQGAAAAPAHESGGLL